MNWETIRRIVRLNHEEITAALDGERYLAEEDAALEKEAEDIIKWSDELDFQKYSDEWFFKSTIFINIDPN